MDKDEFLSYHEINSLAFIKLYNCIKTLTYILCFLIILIISFFI